MRRAKRAAGNCFVGFFTATSLPQRMDDKTREIGITGITFSAFPDTGLSDKRKVNSDSTPGNFILSNSPRTWTGMLIPKNKDYSDSKIIFLVRRTGPCKLIIKGINFIMRRPV